ncbi:hypothetical protein GCM10017786_25760 [Amycolatopsis deserti]|uniref:PPE family domain-containing protein n=1 Tax=Amycolatopsis deserti TaxID=185696 RepID=A0ABQ3IS99_9PSEU|nr:hypothetical protein [Amycolatopsis deserti]GHE91996.1 hypothetical protein GCM10017786_25760 [Amycolatopsis deserti]
MGDDYFGYDLSKIGTGVGGGYYNTGQKTPPAMCKTYDFEGEGIESLYLAVVKGEQPGTTADRARQWGNVELMIQTVADNLREQTQTLADHWKSPGAKEVFLGKVGMTLAYLRQWQDAALHNSTALYGLSNTMYEAQAKMQALYDDYKAEKKDAMDNATHDMGAFYAAKVGTKPGDAKDKLEAGNKVTEKYDQQARKLAQTIANQYAPYIYKLEAAHGPKLEVLNAILHPEATGGPRPPTLNAPGAPGTPPGGSPGAPPGSAPGAPGNAPNAPGHAPKAPGDSPAFNANNAPTENPAFNGKEAPTAPPGPAPVAPTAPGPAPTAPNGITTTPPPPGNAPGIDPALLGLAGGAAPMLANGFTGGKAPGAPSFGNKGATPNLFSGKAPANVPPTLGLNTTPTSVPGTAPGTPPSFSQNGNLYPPGTITPPPGGQVPQQPQAKEPGGERPGAPTFDNALPFDEHLSLEASSAYRQAMQSAPPAPPTAESAMGPNGSSAPPMPPGGQSPNGRDVQAGRRSGAPLMSDLSERPPAFQPPPSTAPVLNNDSKRNNRGGSAKEAPTGTREGLPPGVGAPPVLSNPHRKAPGKTFSEWMAERKRRKTQQGNRKQSEFAANLPMSTTAVFDGRYSAQEYVAGSAGEIPNVLQAPVPVVTAPDRHAKPVVHADRAQRVVRKDEKAPVADQAAFEVETPGGPVVAAGEREKRYRPAEPSALDGRN